MITITRPKPLVLMILDGYGVSFLEEGNAWLKAKQPNIMRYLHDYPLAAIKAAGIEVGLPWGEMGNSETGHQNIGAGRVIYQPLPRITLAIQDGTFFRNEGLRQAIERVKKNPGAALHTIGLLSNGGVHSHIDHQFALIKLAAEHGLGDRLFIHAFLDGRDSPPDSAGNFVGQADRLCKELKAGRIETLVGRFYAMDRNNNWDRTQQAYDAMVYGKGQQYTTWEEATTALFKNSDTKNFETSPAAIIASGAAPFRPIKDGDAVIFYNFRPERARQLTLAFTAPGFNFFPVTTWQDLFFISMTCYDPAFKNPVAFQEEEITQPLGWALAEAQLQQLRIAESEKFAHVTSFLNGGREEPFPGELRVVIPSVNVGDYSTRPEMSAREISEQTIKEIGSGRYDVIIMNYANPDMVAHTGKFEATVKALEFLDEQIGRVVEITLKAGGAVLLTGDHGHAEAMTNLMTHRMSTDHTTNPVPLVYITADNQQPTKAEDAFVGILSNPIGVLADVAPTVLDILGIAPPHDMTAQSLLSSLS